MPGWDTDEKYTEWRYRIKEPEEMVQDSYASIKITTGIRKLIANLKSDPKGSKVGQSLRFSKKLFTLSQAKAWLKKHPNAKKGVAAKFITLKSKIKSMVDIK